MKSKTMKTNANKIVYGLMIILTGFFMLSISSCSDNDASGTARLQVRLTDAPGDYEEVNIDIQDVQVNTHDDGNDDSGWQSLTIRKGIYDLRKLTNGIDTLLSEADLPAGKISQIRFILGTNNTIRIGGKSLPLTTPSAQQSGLKVQVDQELKAGVTYRIILDFDAALSIVARGNGEYNLKPVIRSITEALDGAIQGTVHPVAAKSTVYAIIGTDTVSTSTNLESGDFLVRGLQSGIYRVVLVPNEGYQSKELTDVTVANGNVTSLGVVELDNL